MIVKKLLAPLVNNKVLQESVHCSIASAAISEPAFDLLMSKLPPKCHVDIVTGLDLPTDPKVLWKALKEYPDRVTFRIYTKNFFHPNVYIFDLPYRKMVAFIGSGNFTMGGLKDHEELSYRIDTEKSVEEVKSWFRSYFEYAIDLNRNIIEEYEKVYPFMKERENITRQEKNQLNAIITGSFSWNNINLNNQYFTFDDYAALDNSKAHLNDPVVHMQRVQVQHKFLELHDQLKTYLKDNHLSEHCDSDHIVSSLDPVYHPEHKLRAMWLAYGRGKKELDNYKAKPMDLIRLQVILRQQDFGIWLMPGKQNSGKEDREYFRSEMKKEDYRNRFFQLVKKLDKEYWVEVAGERRPVSSFMDAVDLMNHTNNDSLDSYFIIGRNYHPADPAISNTAIVTTIKSEFDTLIPLYRMMKDKSFEG